MYIRMMREIVQLIPIRVYFQPALFLLALHRAVVTRAKYGENSKYFDLNVSL